jgi:hypothetical protein
VTKLLQRMREEPVRRNYAASTIRTCTPEGRPSSATRTVHCVAPADGLSLDPASALPATVAKGTVSPIFRLLLRTVWERTTLGRVLGSVSQN